MCHLLPSHTSFKNLSRAESDCVVACQNISMAYNLSMDLSPGSLTPHSHNGINSVFCLEVRKSSCVHDICFQLLDTDESFLWVSSIVAQFVGQYLPRTRTAFAGFYGKPLILCLTRIGLVPKHVLEVPKTDLPKKGF